MFDGARIAGEFVRKGPVAVPVGGVSVGSSLTKLQVTVVVTGRDGQTLTLVGPAEKAKEAGAFTSTLERASSAALLRERARQGDVVAQHQVDKAIAMTKRTSIIGAGMAAVMVVSLVACVASAGEESKPSPNVASAPPSVEVSDGAANDRADDRRARKERQAQRQAEKEREAKRAALKEQRDARAARQAARREQKARAAEAARREQMAEAAAQAAREEQVSYANCSEVEAAGAAPIYEGEPGYSTHLDRDRDGIACDQ